jgi:hypothetical protein
MTVTVQVTTNPITVLPVSEVTDAEYVFVLADRLKITKANRGTAQTFTVPPDSAVDFPDGTLINGFQAGAGQVTIAAGSGVTITAADSALTTRKQGSPFVLWKETTNTWYLWGDTVA